VGLGRVEMQITEYDGTAKCITCSNNSATGILNIYRAWAGTLSRHDQMSIL